jgi:thermitase
MCSLRRSAPLILLLALTLQLAPPGQAQAVGGDQHDYAAEGMARGFPSSYPLGVRSVGSQVSDNVDEESGPGARASRGSPPVRSVSVSRGGRTFSTVTYESEAGPGGREVGSGTFLVKFKHGAGQNARSAAHQAVGALAVDTVGLADVERIQVPRGGVAGALAAYQGRADVEYAEPDYIVRGSFTPNDPRLGEQWGVSKIGAPHAWDRTRSRPDIRVAILDCGIFEPGSSSFLAPDGQRGHPDLRNGKVVAQINLTASPRGADDFCNHGTHVAGIAAASTNNGVGVAGVGFDASIMNAKVLDDTGSGLVSTAAQGIVWATDNGARVINLSLGHDSVCSQTAQLAVDYAWARNVVVVAAAGNSNLPASGQPANCANVISVAATDQADNRASFSNFGQNVDVAAPGVGILSTNYVGGYQPISGTSQAAPHVAGLAALVWATEHGASNQTVVSRILSTADRIPGTGSLWAHGRINAAASVAASGPPPCPSPRPAVRLAVSRVGADAISVSVTAGHFTLSSLRFGNATNARIDVPGGQSNMTGNFNVALPAGTTSTTFTVRRAQAGAMTVPLTVVDGCGDWRTFVGRGTS